MELVWLSVTRPEQHWQYFPKWKKKKEKKKLLQELRIINKNKLTSPSFLLPLIKLIITLGWRLATQPTSSRIRCRPALHLSNFTAVIHLLTTTTNHLLTRSHHHHRRLTFLPPSAPNYIICPPPPLAAEAWLFNPTTTWPTPPPSYALPKLFSEKNSKPRPA